MAVATVGRVEEDIRASKAGRTHRGSDRMRTLYGAFFLVFLAFPLLEAWHLGGWRAPVGSLVVLAFGGWYVVGLLAGEEPRPAWLRWLRAWQWLAGLIVLVAAVTVVIGPMGLWLLFFVASGAGGAVPHRGGLVLIGLAGVTHVVVAGLLGMEWAWAAGIGAWVVVVGLSVWFSTRADVAQRALMNEREQKSALAVDLERVRLARDLHDILGHSLTVVTVKAQLAGRLVDADPERAKAEIADVERLARDALTDVRSTVRSYRELSLVAELAGARRALEAAEIAAEIPGSAEQVRSDYRELFAWVVREGVTNVIRHSGATSVVVRLRPTDLEIEDDGRGLQAGHAAGNGLTGLSERARSVGAEISVVGGTSGRGALLRVVGASAEERVSR